MQEAIDAEDVLVEDGAPSEAPLPERERPRTAPSPELQAAPISTAPASPASAPEKPVRSVAPLANVDDTIRAALRDHDRLHGRGDDAAVTADGPQTLARPRPIWIALAVLVFLVAIGIAVYVVDAPDAPVTPPATSRQSPSR